MRRWIASGLLCLVVAPLQAIIIFDDPDLIKRRGDANNDQAVNSSDASYISNYLFHGGPEPPCMNQADVNDDGQITSADSSYLLNWLFMGGPAPPPPGPVNPYCEDDPTPPNLGCLNYICD
jgi:hypothetical protein